MSAKLLEGKPVADQVMSVVRERAARLRAFGVTPGLVTVLVGDDAASAGYVRKKHEAMTVAMLLQNTVELAERAAEGCAGARRDA
jgi:methylenetetrahydrofolate dehydrogenase (NADP+) / methenyltetrahydrofolate cyclohydrolase